MKLRLFLNLLDVARHEARNQRAERIAQGREQRAEYARRLR